jgi:hypothetical protein
MGWFILLGIITFIGFVSGFIPILIQSIGEALDDTNHSRSKQQTNEKEHESRACRGILGSKIHRQ